MIENKTKYTQEILKNFIKYSTFRSRIITYISSAVILICSIVEFLLEDVMLGALFLGLGAFFLVTNLFIVKLSLKKSTTMPEISNDYQFMPESFTITTFSKAENVGTSTIPYISIYKLIEKNDCLYIYLNKVQALLVDIKQFKDISDKEIVKRYIENCKGKILT